MTDFRCICKAKNSLKQVTLGVYWLASFTFSNNFSSTSGICLGSLEGEWHQHSTVSCCALPVIHQVSTWLHSQFLRLRNCCFTQMAGFIERNPKNMQASKSPSSSSCLSTNTIKTGQKAELLTHCCKFYIIQLNPSGKFCVIKYLETTASTI